MKRESTPVSEWSFFALLISEEGGRVIEPVLETHKNEAAQVTWNLLYDLDGPTIIDRTPSARERYVARLFRGMCEITRCFETLADIAVYINRFPYRGTAVTEVRYLRYHVENYFQDLYILRERLVSYLNVVTRSFARETDASEIKLKVNSLSSLVRGALESMVQVRDAHVHEYRIDPDDLWRLDELSLLVRAGSKDISEHFAEYYRSAYKSVRKKWRQTVMANNEQLGVLLDKCGSVLVDILFHKENRKLRCPKRYQ